MIEDALKDKHRSCAAKDSERLTRKQGIDDPTDGTRQYTLQRSLSTN